MAIPFTRSMRALHADSHLSTLISLSIALALLLIWTAWFFLARIDLSTKGQIVTATRTGTLLAAFPASERDMLRRGQQARVHLQGNSAAPRQPLSAIVAEVRQPTRENQVLVELYVREDMIVHQFLQQGWHGEVEISLARVSPATLVMRSGTVP